jgi:hypothetical protein
MLRIIRKEFDNAKSHFDGAGVPPGLKVVPPGSG